MLGTLTLGNVVACSVWAGTGALVGAGLLPKLGNALLVRSYRRSHDWFCEVLSTNPCQETYDRLCDMSAREHHYTFAPTAAQRVLCALLLALLFMGVGLSGAPLYLALLLAAAAFATALAVVCDLRARVIPWECCALVAGAGAVFQLLVFGWRGFLGAVCTAAVVYVVCRVVNRLLGGGGQMEGQEAVGGGDVRLMMALSILCGAATGTAALACFAVAALVAIAGLVLKKLQPKTGMPLAPFLAVWMFVGVVLV